MWEIPAIDPGELTRIEAAITQGIAARSTDGLHVFGFGELGLAIGWPSESPTMVCKRQAPGRPDEVRSDAERMRAYQEALRVAGAGVVPTLVESVEVGPEWMVPYLIQPVLDGDTLADHVLATSEPDPEHPIVMAIRDLAVEVVRDEPDHGLSFDGQVTNFVWVDDQLHILDTTPPLIWDHTTGPFHDVGAYLHAIPAPFRSTALSITKRNGDDYRTVRGTLLRTAMYLHRIDLDAWVAPAIATFNTVLDQPLTTDEVAKGYHAATKDFPLIKRLARMQRFWTERVRRRRYEFFITDSFSGQIL